MQSSWILRHVALVRTDVSEEYTASIVFLRSVLRLLVTSNVLPSSLIISTLMKEAICSTQTSILTSPTRHHIPEGDNFTVTAVKTSNLT
jgi:hypothetical protein